MPATRRKKKGRNQEHQKKNSPESDMPCSSPCSSDTEETAAFLAPLLLEAYDEVAFASFEKEHLARWLASGSERAAEFWETAVAQASFGNGANGVSGLIETVRFKMEDDDGDVSQIEKWAAMRAYFGCLRVPGAMPFRAFDAALVSKALSVIQQWGNARAKESAAARKRKRGESSGTQPSSAEDIPDSLVRAVAANMRACMGTAVGSAVASDMEMLPVAVDAVIALTAGACEAKGDTSAILARIASITPSGGVAEEGYCERVVMKRIMPLILMSTPAATSEIQSWALNVAAVVFAASPNEAAIATTLLQHICFRVSDKTSGRAIAAETVSTILESVSEARRSAVYKKFSRFVVKLGSSPKIHLRAFATEAAFTLFSMAHKNPALLIPSSADEAADGCDDRNEPADILEAITLRCSDRAPTVRVAAIRVVRKLLDLFLEDDGSDEMLAGLAQQLRAATAVVCERVNDEKSGVRRAALFVASILLQHGDVVFARGKAAPAPNGIVSSIAVSKQDAENIARRINDTSLLVRKLAMDCVHVAWKRYPRNASLCEMWIKGVLPSVRDTEASVQKKSLDLLHEAVFQDILTNSVEDTCAWHLMPHLCEETTSCLKHALCMLSRDQNYPLENLIESLSDVASSSMDALFASPAGDESAAAILGAATGSWTLLGFFCGRALSSASNNGGQMAAPDALLIKAGLEHLDGTFARTEWLRATKLWESPTLDALLPSSEEKTSFVDSLQSKVLDVLAGAAHRLPSETAAALSSEILSNLKEFYFSENQVQRLVETLVSVKVGAASTPADARKDICAWGSDVLSVCAGKLSEYVTSPDENMVGDVYSACALIGSVVMVGFDVHDPKAALIPVPSDLTALVQSLLPASFPQEDQEIPCGVRAHAFVCVGKLCLRSKTVAESTVLPLVRELAVCPEPILRSNILIVLGDLCRCYTNTIDAHLDTIAASLNDSDPLVRRHAIIVISGLLQEDYIKWRSSLLFRYLACTSDADAEIATLSRHALASIFLKKTPTLFQVNFVECLFVFADCVDHPKYNVPDFFGVKSLSKTLLHQLEPLSASFDRRMAVYDFMLQHMSEVHKLEAVGKLCRVILGGVLDGVVHLASDPSDGHQTLLNDAFAVLALSSIRCKLPSSARAEGDAEEAIADAEAMSASQEKVNALQAARSKVMAKLARQTVMEKITPLLASLYRKMQEERSPMVKNVMDYLVVLHEDFKTEVMDGLKCDIGMARELEYEILKRQKKVEEERLLAEAQALERDQDADDDMEDEDGAHISATTPARDFKTPKATRSSKKIAVSSLRISTCKSSAKCLARTPRAALTPMGIMSHQAIGALSGKTPEVTVKSAPRLKPAASSEFYDAENSDIGNESSKKKLVLKMKTPSSLRLKSIMKQARSDADDDERPAKVARVSFGSLGSLPTPK